MRRILGPAALALAGLVGSPIPMAAQLASEPVTVSSDHPRLLLRASRLRLLRRERERGSARWQQFEALVTGGAPLPEPAFTAALYFQVSGDAAAARRAIALALGRDTDLRQQALVFDWCQNVLTEAQRRDLTARLEKAIGEPASENGVAAARSRAFAAIALFDHVPDAPQRELERIVRTWWLGKTVPALKEGRNPIARDEAYALMELFHAMRDNSNLDLREADPPYFKDFPIEHLMSYYPAVYEGPDTQYFIGATRKPGEPDLRKAALSRAAEMAMVAYDNNAPETQVLQGWLMHDKFILRGPFGAPYEFLWANPYQPGLSYYHVPLVYYNPDSGRLFIRSAWEEGAKWFGYFDGVMQVFEDGKPSVIEPAKVTAPISLGEAVVCLAQSQRKFHVTLGEEAEAVFLMGLQPGRAYEVEIDDEEMYEATADAGGTIPVEPPRGREVGIRLKERASGF